MSVSYLHGIESIEIDDGARSIKAVKSSVIGLIGTAPVWSASDPAPLNKIVTITNRRAGVRRFGSDYAGYSIPQALAAIFDQGGAEILVINVFDSATHNSTATDEAMTLNARGKATLAHPGVLATPTIKSSDGNTTYVHGDDYTWTAAGDIVRVATGDIPAEASLKASYTYADPSKVLAADIIGAVDPDTEEYTGMQLFEISYSLLGLFPKVLIAPGYADQRAVSVALASLASNIRAVALIDAPVGRTVQETIEARGANSDPFNTSSERLVLCYPRVKVYDADTNSTRLEPLSQRMAGLISTVDDDEGYWVSPSNHEIAGIIGPERLLTARLNDAETDVNKLNEAGIVTIFNSFGTGYRLWGNRTAAWPVEPHPKNFLAVRRTADMLAESIEFSMLKYLDRPITNVLIDAIAESVNQFIRTLIGRGGLIDGKCWFDAALNPYTEIALGHLTFSVDFMPPPPAERITFEHYMDLTMLAQLTGSAA